MKLLQRTPKCALKLYFKAMKVLFVCVFLISRTRPFFNIITVPGPPRLAFATCSARSVLMYHVQNVTKLSYHFHNKFRAIFDFERFFENLKNGSIDLFKTLIIYT